MINVVEGDSNLLKLHQPIPTSLLIIFAAVIGGVLFMGHLFSNSEWGVILAGAHLFVAALIGYALLNVGPVFVVFDKTSDRISVTTKTLFREIVQTYPLSELVRVHVHSWVSHGSSSQRKTRNYMILMVLSRGYVESPGFKDPVGKRMRHKMTHEMKSKPNEFPLTGLSSSGGAVEFSTICAAIEQWLNGDE